MAELLGERAVAFVADLEHAVSHAKRVGEVLAERVLANLRRPAREGAPVEELPPVRGAVPDLIEPVALDDGAKLDRREKLDELARGGRAFCAGRDAGRERADALRLVGQRADVV